MNRHITITGELGSGKSTVAKLVAQQLGFTFFSTGDAHRQLAEKLHMTTLQLNERALTDKSIDQQIDSQFQALDNQDKPYVVDSRLAFHFLPNSFKVMLMVDPLVGAQRIMNAQRSSEAAYTDVQACLKANEARRKIEQQRFMDLYRVDISNKNAFDYVLDTTNQTPEDAAKALIFQYKQYMNHYNETFCYNP